MAVCLSSVGYFHHQLTSRISRRDVTTRAEGSTQTAKALRQLLLPPFLLKPPDA